MIQGLKRERPGKEAYLKVLQDKVAEEWRSEKERKMGIVDGDYKLQILKKLCE